VSNDDWFVKRRSSRSISIDYLIAACAAGSNWPDGTPLRCSAIASRLIAFGFLATIRASAPIAIAPPTA
jgi:hypothetical protein